MRGRYLSTFCKWMSWCQSHCPPGFHPPPLVQRFWSLSWCSLITVESLLKNHTEVTQQQLRRAFNWIIRTACSIIICVFISNSIACRVFSPWMLLTRLFAHSVLRCKLRKKRQHMMLPLLSGGIVCNEPRRTHSNSHLLLHLHSSNDNMVGEFLREALGFPQPV